MGEMDIQEKDIDGGITNGYTIATEKVITIIGQIQRQTIGIEDRGMRQEMIIHTVEVETVIGSRMTMGEIHQKPQEETVGQAAAMDSCVIGD